jgi:hypothetical protein
VRDFVQGLRAAGESDFEVLLRRTLQFTNGLVSAQDAGRVGFTFQGVEVSLPTMAREYIWRDLVADEVLRAIGDGADVIAELGSGWSANLFTLWLRGAPKSALYAGGEFTRGGREAGSAVAAALPGMRYAAPAFDWSNPDFGFIPGDARRVTVYSCYSIEQIPQLDPACLRELLARTAQAQSVSGVFIEPVGFQFPEYCPNPDMIEPSRSYAQEKNYNLNLRAAMETLVQEGCLKVVAASFDAFGSKVNPATIIHWQRA